MNTTKQERAEVGLAPGRCILITVSKRIQDGLTSDEIHESFCVLFQKTRQIPDTDIWEFEVAGHKLCAIFDEHCGPQNEDVLSIHFSENDGVEIKHHMPQEDTREAKGVLTDKRTMKAQK